MKARGKDRRPVASFTMALRTLGDGAMVQVRALFLTIAGLLGTAGAVVPTLAAGSSLPSSGSFTAHDFSWDADSGGHTVTIAQGGTVKFSYPLGLSEHNADFTAAQPSSCVQTGGPSSGSVPPLPHQATGEGWTGTCTFDKPGTYTFKCDQHSFMTGTVAVQATGTSPTSSPLAGSASQAIRVRGSQRGGAVRGSVKVSAAGAGGSLTATVRARASDLGRRGKALLTVGRTSLGLRPGTVAFSVGLNRQGKRALGQRGTLTVQLNLVVRSPSGAAIRVSRRITLRR